MCRVTGNEKVKKYTCLSLAHPHLRHCLDSACRLCHHTVSLPRLLCFHFFTRQTRLPPRAPACRVFTRGRVLSTPVSTLLWSLLPGACLRGWLSQRVFPRALLPDPSMTLSALTQCLVHPVKTSLTNPSRPSELWHHPAPQVPPLPVLQGGGWGQLWGQAYLTWILNLRLCSCVIMSN